MLKSNPEHLQYPQMMLVTKRKKHDSFIIKNPVCIQACRHLPSPIMYLLMVVLEGRAVVGGYGVQFIRSIDAIW